MPAPFRLTVVTAAWDPVDPDEPAALLRRMAALTGWCDAIQAADVPVTVVQRFSRTAALTRAGVGYRFVHDDGPPRLGPGDAGTSVARAVAATTPDVVHVNGLGFPALVASLRTAIGAAPLIVVQDHGGSVPPKGGGWLDDWRRRRWASGLAQADAASFTAAAHAAPWREAGILDRHDVLALPTRSTHLRPTPRDEARARTNLSGDPLVVWLGRLTPGKDPLAVLSGFERFAVTRPQARLVLATPGGPLFAAVRARIDASPVLMTAVRMLGAVAPDDLADLHGAADLYISGSHSEGSADTLIEALACGVLPVVTSIPAFEAIAGGCGTRFAPGHSAACADALRTAAAIDAAERRRLALARFEQALSWPVIAAQTRRDYETLLARRAARRR